MKRSKIGVVIHTRLRDVLFAEEDAARLETLGEVTWTGSPEKISDEDAIKILADCEVGIGSWGTPWPSADIVAACPGLRLWEHAAGTVKHMFGPHLAGRDLTIASCKTAIGDNVAAMTLGEIILGLWRVFENAAENRKGRATKPAKLKIMFGSTVGVVGASEVGKRVMKLLAPLGCRILLYDPYVSPEGAREMGAELVTDLAELCEKSDAVTLHTPPIPATEKMMGAREFRAMKDDAVFVNTARGMCVDEGALTAELEGGRLFAFIDVSTPEPAADDSPLRRLPNVVYTSHIAGGPGPNIGRQAVDDVAAFLGGGSPMCVVREEELERTA